MGVLMSMVRSSGGVALNLQQRTPVLSSAWKSELRVARGGIWAESPRCLASFFHRCVGASHTVRFHCVVSSVAQRLATDLEQYHVTPAEKHKIAGDVGIRRQERRRMRAKLKVSLFSFPLLSIFLHSLARHMPAHLYCRHACYEC